LSLHGFIMTEAEKTCLRCDKIIPSSAGVKKRDNAEEVKKFTKEEEAKISENDPQEVPTLRTYPKTW